MLVFGRYEILSELAQGGMGTILLARQQGGSFERLVAVKRLRHEEGSEEQARLFVEEARLSSQLNHPNVVSVYDAGEWEGSLYLVMEYIEGVSLSALAREQARRREPLGWALIARVVRDVARGLHHAHAAVDPRGAPLRIVHRDVSPQNVMVRRDGHVKVVDFGIAHAVNRTVKTRTGIVRGKMRYLSPEQFRGEPLDARSDQFSLGVMAWELFTGRSLYQGADKQQLVELLTVRAPPLRSAAPQLPADLEPLVTRMLEKDRTRRFVSCEDVAVALDGLLTPLGSDEALRAELASIIQRGFGAQLDARRSQDEGPSTTKPRSAPTGARCPQCGFTNGPAARFCNQCGAGLVTGGVEAPTAKVESWSGARRPMVVLGARWRPEEASLEALHEAFAQAVERRGGRVVSQSTASMVATFGPHEIEAAAVSAAQCALDLVRSDVGAAAQTRAVLDAGPVVVVERAGGVRVSGGAVEAVEAGLSDLEPQVVLVRPPLRALASQHLTLRPRPGGSTLVSVADLDGPTVGPFVGRRPELARLTTEPRVWVVGPEGAGKSRLLRVFAGRVPTSVLVDLGAWRVRTPPGLELWAAMRASIGADGPPPLSEFSAWRELVDSSKHNDVQWLLDDADALEDDELRPLLSQLVATELRCVATSARALPIAPGFAELPLGGLLRDELEALAHQTLGGPVSSGVLAQLVDASNGGLPGPALELLRTWRADGLIELRGGQHGFTQVPAASSLRLRSRLEHRLDGLSAEARTLATRAAVLGREGVEAWLAGEPAQTLAAWLELERAGFVSRSEGEYVFLDRSATELLVDRLPPPEREALGASLLAVVEASPVARRELQWRAQLRLAGFSRDGRVTLEVTELVGDQLAAAGRLEPALEALTRAQTLAAADPVHTAELAVKVGRLLSLTHRDRLLAQVDAALAALDRERLPVHTARLEVLAVHELVSRGEAVEASARLVRARAAASTAGDSELDAEVLGAAAVVHLDAGRVDDAEAALVEAFQVMNGQEATWADFYWVHLNLLGRARLAVGQFELGRAAFISAEQQAARVGRPHGVARALLNQAAAAISLGHSSGALPLLERAELEARQSGDVDALARVGYTRGAVAAAAGQFAEASRAYAAAREWARAAGWTEGLALAQAALDGLERLPPAQLQPKTKPGA